MEELEELFENTTQEELLQEVAIDAEVIITKRIKKLINSFDSLIVTHINKETNTVTFGLDNNACNLIKEELKKELINNIEPILPNDTGAIISVVEDGVIIQLEK